jgi:hypothetical protein
MSSLSNKRARILTLDLLRGLFLVIIFVDHLAYAPSLFFQFATGTSSAFASAAEGFFAISGILVGYIYGPKILQATRTVTIKIWKRAALLYGLTVGFTLLYTAWAALLPGGYPRQPNWTGDIGGLLLQATTLQFHFGWADFLARYAVFMVFAPLAVWLVAKHHAWIVAIVSIGIWFFWREAPGLQPFTAWQIVFMFGIIIGYYLPRLEEQVSSWRPNIRRILWWSVISIAAVSYVAVVTRLSIVPVFMPELHDKLPNEWLPLFDRNSVGFVRILIGIIWFSGLYLLFRRFEEAIDRFTMGALLLLGKNSLFVYSIEAFIIFLIDVSLPAPAHSRVIVNTIIGIAGIGLVYLVTRYRKEFLSWSYNKNNEIT